MKRRKRHHQGFALLLTLVLLMIAAVALAQLARQSAGEALRVREQTEAMQRQWAVVSCRATLLPRASGLLDRPATGWSGGAGAAQSIATTPGSRSQLRVSCELSGQRYELVFTDEQAKYNPTVMGQLKLSDQALVSAMKLRGDVRDLSGLSQGQADRSGIRVRLLPMVGFDASGREIDSQRQRDEETHLFAGYGQLFEGADAADLVGVAGKTGLASAITCWGDGRLHLRRCPSAVIERVLGPVLGSEGVRQVLIQRAKSPGQDPMGWLDAASAATPEQRALAGTMLTDQSDTQGLWVIAHGCARSWYTFAVRVHTPLAQLQAQRDAQISAEELTKGVEPEPLPHPIQRYDFAW